MQKVSNRFAEFD